MGIYLFVSHEISVLDELKKIFQCKLETHDVSNCLFSNI